MIVKQYSLGFAFLTGVLVAMWSGQAEASLPVPDMQLMKPSILDAKPPPAAGFNVNLELNEDNQVIALRRRVVRRRAVGRAAVKTSAVRAGRRGLVSPAAAWALSFFVTFGAGNYYARAYVAGVICTVGDLLAITFFSIGAVYGYVGLWVPSMIAWIGLWVFDWGYAIYAARRFNAARARADLVTPPATVPTPDGRELAYVQPVFTF